MTFQKLAQYFEKLEETSSRLTLIEILAELFSEIKTEEIPMVTYLIQGRVAPFYEPIELGMAEKSVAASIARAYGTDREKILTMYGQMGDLGKVALELSTKALQRHPERSSEGSQDYKNKPGDSSSATRNDKKTLTVEEVFEELKKISQFSGSGTVENKIQTLTNLLKKSSGIEAKHLVRIPLGTSRLGIGDPTILDAFALSKLGDRSKRKLLEGAYNKVSDLGLIGQTLWKGGLKAIEKLDVVVGRPIRSQLAERLPDPEAILKKFEGSAHVQKKFDGFRVQIHMEKGPDSAKATTGEQGSRVKGQDIKPKVRFFSRNLEETTNMFPDLVEGVLKQVKADSVILDSEALAYNPESDEFLPFQETTKRRRKHGIEESAKNLPLKAMVFDVMYLNGKSLMNEILKVRIAHLQKIIQGDEVLVPQPGEITDDPKRIQQLFDEALTAGLEGLIVKKPDSLYEAGARNFNWVKQKRNSSGELKDTVDCVILGYVFGKGKRSSFGAGALLVGVYDDKNDEFVTVSKIGTGLTDEEWREVHKRADKIKVDHKPARINAILKPSVWIKPEIVIEVLADEITRSPVHTAGKEGSDPGFALRFPRLVKFRESDKKAENATTVKELIEMYNQQYERGSSVSQNKK